MSRRSHRHGPAHARPHRPEGSHQAAPATRVAPASPRVEPGPPQAAESDRSETTRVADQVAADPVINDEIGAEAVAVIAPPAPVPTAVASAVPGGESLPLGAEVGPEASMHADAPIRTATCTTAQLRRFIKSRAYMPMHELRRRFLINGSEDDVTRVEVGGGIVFVGLPEREGRMLGDLLRGGEVGYELSHDPVSPIVVGVFPMRPIPRA